MESLYVVEQNCILRKKSKRFLVDKKDGEKIEIPAYKIDNIVLFGRQSITPQAFQLALDNNIDVIFLSMYGNFKGKLQPKLSKNINLRISQYEFWRDDVKRLELARIIIKNKVINQKKLLKYYGVVTKEFDSLIGDINVVAESIDVLMGYEGAASRIYFSKLSSLIKEPYTFKERSRRPPKDEVNALLSLTYKMVLNKIITELEIVGLDSYLGVLHSIKYGRESLALDVLEEFRQGFCDHFVIKLINRNEINIENFEKKSNGARYLKEEEFKKYLFKFNSEYNKYLKSSLEKQIIKLKKVILEDEIYKPYSFNKRS